MKNTSVVLGKQHTAFIKKQVRKGRFGSASEAVRAGLQLLEEQELRMERLRTAINEGDASGEPEPFDIEEFIAEKKKAAR
ncbi:type II toxin-antitoxin system ParD family antitoxin [Nordella sp. HKS 07]|uniref:type II toxin-antitoxin system ParD family antitoxin n=1 Tax=Nordella sp. HKS 07 TaxID=2712222 RepID=UPI0013E14850|nr:type II toxin-antitoxin system ParD family antitoxin [Nordella sp. HKS 07]QIG46369.1 type II toxin-antitoxin system ParD family antitoxin [Nordella sp. HKS 07]